MKLLEHAMKIDERVLAKQIRTLINLNKIRLGFMPRKGTEDVTFIVRKMQKEYRKKKKQLHMCFVDMNKAFSRV